MAVLPRHCRAGGGAHMSEEQMRAQMAAEVTEILVRPSRACFTIKTNLGMIAVPAETKAVAIRAGGRLERADDCHEQRMLALGEVGFERRGLAPVCDPATHG